MTIELEFAGLNQWFGLISSLNVIDVRAVVARICFLYMSA